MVSIARFCACVGVRRAGVLRDAFSMLVFIRLCVESPSGVLAEASVHIFYTSLGVNPVARCVPWRISLKGFPDFCRRIIIVC